MELKITTLIENSIDDKNELINEHGLSMFIEFDKKRILFDTGQTGDFLKNAKNLGVNLDLTDYLVVSHGHYDHSGGVIRFLDQTKNNKIKMYVSEEFFDEKYKIDDDGTYIYNGNSFSEKDIIDRNVSLDKIKDTTCIAGNIILFKNFEMKNDYEKVNKKFVKKSDKSYVTDLFMDEIALGLVTKRGLVIVVGCSHAGIINIISAISEKINIPIYAVIGGTHLVKADEKRIHSTIYELKKMGINYIATSHCTGQTAVTMIQKEFKEKFIVNNTGNIFCF